MAAEYLERMGARIRARREELHLTQEDVARRFPGRTTGNQISRWERGANRPGDQQLEALAKVLDVPVAYFFAPPPTSNGTDVLSALRPADGQLDRIERLLQQTSVQVSDLEHTVAKLATAVKESGPRNGEAVRRPPREPLDTDVLITLVEAVIRRELLRVGLAAPREESRPTEATGRKAPPDDQPPQAASR